MTDTTPHDAADAIGASNHRSSALCGNLRQMIAVLETERQALATLQPDTLFAVTQEKAGLCDCLADIRSETIDDEARALAQTAKSLNDVNRRVRNLLAANVSGRLDTLSGQRGTQQYAYTAQNAAQNAAQRTYG